jgi:hypothetical protein
MTMLKSPITLDFVLGRRISSALEGHLVPRSDQRLTAITEALPNRNYEVRGCISPCRGNGRR